MITIMEGLNGYIEVDEILNRLAAYEDTGLEPNEINALKQQLLEVTAERDALQKSVNRIMKPIETIQPRGITE